MSKRRFHRHTKRLETTFSEGSTIRRGMTSDISEGGIFIRTRYALAPGTVLDIEIHLPDNTVAKVKGRVKRSIKTPISTFKNGMGIELMETDSKFNNLVRSIVETASDHGLGESPAARKGHASPSAHPAQETVQPPPPEYLIIACGSCNAKNKVASVKLSLGPKCGRCGMPLKADGII